VRERADRFEHETGGQKPVINEVRGAAGLSLVGRPVGCASPARLLQPAFASAKLFVHLV
jgi:hypothetical protein